jgi:spore germination protein KA
MRMFSNKKEYRSGTRTGDGGTPDAEKTGERAVSGAAEQNVAAIRRVLGKDIGLIVKRYVIFKTRLEICLVYLDSMADKKTVGAQLLEPLLEGHAEFNPGHEDVFDAVLSRVTFSSAVDACTGMDTVLTALMGGKTILFAQGEERALLFDTQQAQHRPVEKPENEAAMLGAQDSLTEDIGINCNLITKRLKNPDLKFRSFTAGKLSQTQLKLLWIEGIAAPGVVEEAVSRLGRLDTDIIDGVGHLAELIRDSPLSIFPTYKQTQRPDVIARCLSDGQFAILCDNSPYAFVAPCSFWDQFKTADDYAQSTLISTYLRWIRYLSFVISSTISALYLAVVTHNHSIVPPELATAIATGRDGVPFPSLVEILLLTIIISIIREASLRIPGATGYFIGTMSAIVIGQAAVSAGYVSASVIIVISISVISAFAVSSSPLLYTTRLINYALILMAGLLGMFGLINGIVVVIWYMLSLKSFGLPYMYPAVPFDREALKDTLIKAPARALQKRFRLLAPTNAARTKEARGPSGRGPA